MVETIIFKEPNSYEKMTEWAEKNKDKFEMDIIFIENGYGIEYKPLMSIMRLNKTQEFVDKMAQYVAYQKDKTGRKSDSWYDKTEMKLKQQGFDKLYKQYKKLGGKQELEDF